MVFHLRVQDQPDGSRRLFSCWNEVDDYRARQRLGHFKYYQFIRTLFWDFSSDFRSGSIDFIKPGDGKTCVSWKLPESLVHLADNVLIKQLSRKVKELRITHSSRNVIISPHLECIDQDGCGVSVRFDLTNEQQILEMA